MPPRRNAFTPYARRAKPRRTEQRFLQAFERPLTSRKENQMNKTMTTRSEAFAVATTAFAIFLGGCVTLEETISRANGGDGAAQYSLYEAYSSGDFKGQKVEKNRQLALDYLAKAAESKGDNKKYQQELLNCYMRDGRLDKMDEIIAKYSKTLEPKWSWSEAANIIDTSDFREIAQKYVMAILQQPYPTQAEAKKVFAQADKFNEFAQQTLLVADIYNYDVFDQSAAKKTDTNYQIERRSAYERASKLGLRNGDYKLTVSSFNCLADIHNAIVDAKNKYGEVLAEEKRKAEEQRLVEEKRIAEEKHLAKIKRKERETEEKRIAEEQRLVEEKRKAEGKRTEEKRKAEVHAAEDKRIAEGKCAEEKKNKTEAQSSWTTKKTEHYWSSVIERAWDTDTAPRLAKADAEKGEGILEAFGNQYMPNAYDNYEKVRSVAIEREQKLKENFPHGEKSDSTGGGLYGKISKATAKAVAEYFRRRDELCHFYLMHKAGVMTEAELAELDSAKICTMLYTVCEPSSTSPVAPDVPSPSDLDFAHQYKPETFAAYERLKALFDEGLSEYLSLRDDAILLDAVREDYFLLPFRLRLDEINKLLTMIAKTLKEEKLLHDVEEMTAEQLAKSDTEFGLKAHAAEKSLAVGIYFKKWLETNWTEKDWKKVVIRSYGKNFCPAP